MNELSSEKSKIISQSEAQSKARSEIVKICRHLHSRNLLAACDGNVSYRISDQEILITPSGVNKAFIEEKDIAVITLQNDILSGNPSGERLMHLEVYKKSSKATAIVHAHPPTAIAFSLAFPEARELPADSLSELILAAGRVPIIPYQRPGSLEMGSALHPFLPKHRLMILARHGGISWGESLIEAYNGMERLEHVSQIFCSAFSFQSKGPTPLSSAEIEFLEDLRTSLGEELR